MKEVIKVDKEELEPEELKALLHANFKPAIKVVEFELKNKIISIKRNDYFQNPLYWSENSLNSLLTTSWIKTETITHPKRINEPAGKMVYERFSHEIEKKIAFKVIDPTTDLDIFSEWHNQARINEFWELKGEKEDHLKYIESNLKDEHTTPCLLLIDGKPTGYFEFYWTKEDRLGPIYDSQNYDRGFHFLIGDRRFLGLRNTDAVLKSVVHYMFVDDPRTQRVMAEPRSDNNKVLKYTEYFPAWKKIKEFEFPHKKAVLVECTRDRLFSGDYL